VVLVPQPNSHNFNGQHLQLIPGPASIGNWRWTTRHKNTH
jgi:hypothetical protein